MTRSENINSSNWDVLWSALEAALTQFGSLSAISVQRGNEMW